MPTGYVKLHREAEEHPVFEDEWLWKVFCWCIMRANFRDGKVQRGSFTTGRLEAAERLSASPSRVYRAFDRLRKMGCITLKANNRFTTITVCNYDTYQSDEPGERTTDEQPANNKRTASEQQTNNKKTLLEEGKEWEEGKKGRREEGNPLPPLPPELASQDMQDALTGWLDYKAERNERYKPKGMAAFITHTARLVAKHGEPAIINAMQRAMSHNWQGWDHDLSKANGHSTDPHGNLAARARYLQLDHGDD